MKRRNKLALNFAFEHRKEIKNHREVHTVLEKLLFYAMDPVDAIVSDGSDPYGIFDWTGQVSRGQQRAMNTNMEHHATYTESPTYVCSY